MRRLSGTLAFQQATKLSRWSRQPPHRRENSDFTPRESFDTWFKRAE
jgi:hypothetical protein